MTPTSPMTDVWAPRAATVDVVTADGSRRRLRAESTGWHRGPALPPGERYGLALDHEPRLLPDPRSHFQPEGIEGLTEVVDHGSHPWGDAGWSGFQLPGSVLYELHVGTFSDAGDFDGAIEHLDHLVDLGIDAVELMPVAEAMGRRGWGYDGVLLYAVHHAYGGPDAMKRFVDACHQRGIGVLLDVVYNHFGPKGNHLPRFGPYLDESSSTPWGHPVNLDGECAAEVRRFIIDNAIHWLSRYHLDGLRLDATHALVDRSARHVLADLAGEVATLAGQLERPLWLVAEREQNELLPLRRLDAGGWGLDCRWSDDFHHAVHAAVTGEQDGYYAPFGSLADVATAIERVHVRPGEPVGEDIPRSRFVTCIQNHDQVGNRARGERLSHLAGPAAQMAAAALLLCTPGTPLLFQGEEWAASSPFPYFCDVADDADLGMAIREGRRAEFAAFGWEPAAVPDPIDERTFRDARLRWDEWAEQPHAAVLAFYRRLIALRRRRPDLTDASPGGVRVDVDERRRTVMVHRRATSLAVNLSGSERSVPVPGELQPGCEVLVASHPATRIEAAAVILPPVAACLLGRR